MKHSHLVSTFFLATSLTLLGSACSKDPAPATAGGTSAPQLITVWRFQRAPADGLQELGREFQ